MDNKVLIGGDPELFAMDSEGYCIPPIIFEKIFGLERVGTEDPGNPGRHPFYFNNDGVIVMADGAAFELTFPPASSPQELKNNFSRAANTAREIISSFGLTPMFSPSIKFSLDYLEKTFSVDTHTKSFWTAVHFGCDPQFNIYSASFDQMQDVMEYPWRHAGGHVHISSQEKNLHKVKFVKFCDIILGQIVPAISSCWEQEKIRQFFYGKPGNCRWQNYRGGIKGVEYRTPSATLWTDGIDLIFPSVQKVLELFFSGEEPDDTDLSTAINNILAVDKEGATQLLKKYGIL